MSIVISAVFYRSKRLPTITNINEKCIPFTCHVYYCRNLRCKVIEEQADVLALFCNNAHGWVQGAGCGLEGIVCHGGSSDGDGFLPLSRVQFTLIRGLMVGVGFYVTLTSK